MERQDLHRYGRVELVFYPTNGSTWGDYVGGLWAIDYFYVIYDNMELVFEVTLVGNSSTALGRGRVIDKTEARDELTSGKL